MDEVGKYLAEISWVKNFAGAEIWTHNVPILSILLLPVTLPYSCPGLFKMFSVGP